MQHSGGGLLRNEGYVRCMVQPNLVVLRNEEGVMLQISEIVKRYRSGESMRALSEACGQDRVTVWRRLKSAGEVGRRREVGRECPTCHRPGFVVSGEKVRGEPEAVVGVRKASPGAVGAEVVKAVVSERPALRCPVHALYRGGEKPGSTKCEGCWGVWKGRG